MQNEGWIKLYRDIINSSVALNPNALALFIHILCKSAFKDYKHPTKYGDIDVKKGSFVTSLRKLSTHTGLSLQAIRTSMGYLKSTQRITHKVTHRYSIISVRNWEKYQMPNTLANTLANTVLTQSQHSPNTVLTQEEEYKKDKNVEECKEKKNKDIVFDNTNTRTSVKKKKTDIPPRVKINYLFFMETWNKTLTPRIVSLSRDRRLHIHARCNQDPDFCVHFSVCVDQIKENPFLSGDNNRGWRATFDWIISSPTNYLKIIEGNYSKAEKGLTDEERNSFLQDD